MKRLWSILLVIVMFTAVPVTLCGCGEENEQDKIEKKADEAKDAAKDLLE